MLSRSTRPQNTGQQKCRVQDGWYFLGTLLSDAVGDPHIGADRQPGRYGDQQRGDLTVCAHGSQRVGIRKAPDHRSVHRVKQLLKHTAHGNGQRKPDETAQKRSMQQIELSGLVHFLCSCSQFVLETG